MLQLSFIQEHKDRVFKGLKTRNYKDPEIINKIISLDDQRKELQKELDDLLAERNSASIEIGDLFKKGLKTEAEVLKDRVTEVKEKAAQIQEKLNDTKDQLHEFLLQVPNVPHPSVPGGTSAEDNLVHKAWDKPLPELGPDALPHWDLAKKYDLIDFEMGVKITGSGFPLYKGRGARLERSLINFFLDEATKAGYLEIIPPLMVNAESAYSTGQLPDKEGQMYFVLEDELYLIPTAEVPITNMYRDVIVEATDLPVKLAGYTPCFRREAGSYGKDVRGLNRVHQFDKVEVVQIAHPDQSYKVLEEMLLHVESILNKLELPYRILRLCGGDLGFTSALTFDFEVYSAGQDKWLEVSSVSNFETFQSNRLKLRYREKDQKAQLAHTLNGSALALARIVAALLENNQTAEGIRIPEVLRPYTGFDKI